MKTLADKQATGEGKGEEGREGGRERELNEYISFSFPLHQLLQIQIQLIQFHQQNVPETVSQYLIHNTKIIEITVRTPVVNIKGTHIKGPKNFKNYTRNYMPKSQNVNITELSTYVVQYVLHQLVDNSSYMIPALE